MKNKPVLNTPLDQDGNAILDDATYNKIAQAVLKAYKDTQGQEPFPGVREDKFIESLGGRLQKEGLINDREEFKNLFKEQATMVGTKYPRRELIGILHDLDNTRDEKSKLGLIDKLLDSIREFLGCSNSKINQEAYTSSRATEFLKNEVAKSRNQEISP